MVFKINRNVLGWNNVAQRIIVIFYGSLPPVSNILDNEGSTVVSVTKNT